MHISMRWSDKISLKDNLKHVLEVFFQKDFCIFRQARILKLVPIYKLNVVFCIFNVMKHEKYPTLKSSLYMSIPSHSYHTKKL